MKRSTASPIRLEKFLPYRLSVLANAVSDAIAASYRDRFKLSVPEWRVLAVLAAEPGLSASEVAERTRMDEVAVSRAVSRLLRADRLVRTLDARDRRRSVLRLSREGQAVYSTIAPMARRFERQLLAAIDGPERAALDRALDLLQARAQELQRRAADAR
jgi:DNA-binding MarR family transcriptional regulator